MHFFGGFMKTYTIRVVLHGASWSDYDDLQDNLKVAGVVDTIVGSDGCRYKLPPAEYATESNLTAEQVRDAVYKIASAIKPIPAVFVTQSSGRVWIGLEQVS